MAGCLPDSPIVLVMMILNKGDMELPKASRAPQQMKPDYDNYTVYSYIV